LAFFKLFKRKPDKFLKLLVQQTSLTVKGLECLNIYFDQPGEQTAKALVDVEREADEVRRILIEELMRTFVTPLDREDIFTLSREIDDVLDYAYTTVDEMQILNVSPTSFMKRMGALLYESAGEIELAVERLQDKHLTVASDHCQHAKSLENRVETVYREALADLFKGTKSVKHVVNMLKVREIYRHLSNASDREDSAANVISDIVMKLS
jgi:predicted phosphate transport protein (TIGR00153 family)